MGPAHCAAAANLQFGYKFIESTDGEPSNCYEIKAPLQRTAEPSVGRSIQILGIDAVQDFQYMQNSYNNRLSNQNSPLHLRLLSSMFHALSFATIESCLPSPERADRLCRICLTHMSWMFQIATYQQLTQDLMPAFYRRADRLDVATGEDGPHDLALLLIVFAVGALVDLSLPAYNAEAQRYHILARAALALQPLVEKASLNTVKTLHLISIFNGMSGKESNMANTYTVLNLAGRIAQRVSDS